MFAPCSLTVTSTWRPGLTAHLTNRRPSLSRPVASDVSVDKRIRVHSAVGGQIWSEVSVSVCVLNKQGDRKRALADQSDII